MERISSLSSRIAERIAEREGIDPVELSPPLYEVLDVEQVARLVTKSNADVRVEFTYLGYRVAIEDPNELVITERRTGDGTEPQQAAGSSID
ncbi:HalOD1 output domain-containing protein [Halomicroarcula sp. GCM10025817]|uniref:HalOD1 output domain-containing protein n=1 Tax=Haloarcula TaxID=2237 RepID=UPI0023E8F78F|nr:HalOD1 output domain-containing protein [Halomicroarcula sp. SYNS111]